MTPLEAIAPLEDVPLDIEAVLDRISLTISELLELHPGSLVRLNRSAGENIDILAGGQIIAFGEIVVIENMKCVRVTAFKEQPGAVSKA